MKQRWVAIGVVCFCIAVAYRAPTAAAQSKSAKETAPAEAASTPKVIVYVPPDKGAPGSRIGGGTRAAGQDHCDARIEALVPESPVGLTMKAQPILQWYLYTKMECRLDFVLNERQKSQPVVEKTLAGPMEPGVHQVDLASLGVQLEPGVEYEWFVAIVHDSGRRSRDSVAGGQVMRHAATGETGVREHATSAEVASLYAQQGIWYDALAALTAGIEAQPENSQLREQRAALLDQVGLAEVAARERAAINTPQ